MLLPMDLRDDARTAIDPLPDDHPRAGHGAPPAVTAAAVPAGAAAPGAPRRGASSWAAAR